MNERINKYIYIYSFFCDWDVMTGYTGMCIYHQTKGTKNVGSHGICMHPNSGVSTRMGHG
jgi:hypothetical protein